MELLRSRLSFLLLRSDLHFESLFLFFLGSLLALVNFFGDADDLLHYLNMVRLDVVSVLLNGPSGIVGILNKLAHFLYALVVLLVPIGVYIIHFLFKRFKASLNLLIFKSDFLVFLCGFGVMNLESSKVSLKLFVESRPFLLVLLVSQGLVLCVTIFNLLQNCDLVILNLGFLGRYFFSRLFTQCMNLLNSKLLNVKAHLGGSFFFFIPFLLQLFQSSRMGTFGLK